LNSDTRAPRIEGEVKRALILHVDKPIDERIYESHSDRMQQWIWSRTRYQFILRVDPLLQSVRLRERKDN